jgi:ketosteroid isomerase-like protein
MPSTDTDMPFDPEEIRAAERNLLALLEDPDVSKRTAAYTEDAVFVMEGSPPVEGRAAMIRRTKTRLISCSLTPYSTEGNGRLACVYGRFRCVVVRGESSEGRSVVLRLLMVWRKEPDGVWRIAREFLNNTIEE